MMERPWNRPIFIAGPCAMESETQMREIAAEVAAIKGRLGCEIYFKSSFDKANRSSTESYRSFGLSKGLDSLAAIREEYSLGVTTDIHEPYQADLVAEVVDLIQIPAFLCRQTDLLIEAGETGTPVNIKKGQFMSPEEMENQVRKVTSTGNKHAVVMERGTTFGYNNLVVDMRSFEKMSRFSIPYFDATHSVQRPGLHGKSSGGESQFVERLALASAAAGARGWFFETHPDPSKALSDGPNMIPLAHLEKVLSSVLRVAEASKQA